MAHVLDRTKPMKDDTTERVTKNIDGAFDFLRSLVADPSLVDCVPAGATIYIEHDDDPRTTAKNRADAEKTQRRGTPVYFHRVRVKKAEPPRRLSFERPMSNSDGDGLSAPERFATYAARGFKRDRN